MAVSDTDIREIQAKLAPLIGMAPWEVKKGFGSFITLDFGRPVESIGAKGSTYIHGEWHLWVYMCAWRVDKGNEVQVACQTSQDKMEVAVKAMQGRILESIEVRPPALETALTFEGGIILHLFPRNTDDSDHWLLFMPDGYVLSIGPGNTWSYHRSDEPR